MNPRLSALLQKLPKGRVTSYKALGQQLGLHPRAVARQLAKSDLSVPCYKVIHADGRVSGYILGQKEKIKRLQADGIEVVNGKVSKSLLK